MCYFAGFTWLELNMNFTCVCRFSASKQIEISRKTNKWHVKYCFETYFSNLEENKLLVGEFLNRSEGNLKYYPNSNVFLGI